MLLNHNALKFTRNMNSDWNLRYESAILLNGWLKTLKFAPLIMNENCDMQSNELR